MITEDYVSFETAKLLKEKGFDAECDYLYVNGKLVKAQGFACNWNNGETLFADYKNECSAPTLQMAMKWLREEHKTEIRVIYDNDKLCWYGASNPMNESQILLGSGHKCKSYEEAAEVGIRYCLENLI